MKFYKCHSAKFKKLNVLFLPEQFDEIGPDAFVQTQFEIIVLSRKVKIIRNHAFSGLKKCKVYLPKTITEIEPLAFEDIDIGNEFYCVRDSEAFKICTENCLNINEDVDPFLEYAEQLWLAQEQKENQRKTEERIERRSLAEVKREKVDEKDDSLKSATHPIDRDDGEVSHVDEKSTESLLDDCEPQNQVDKTIFIENFGEPPVFEGASQFGESWELQISELSTDIIVEHYVSDEYCAEYRYYCYVELKKRFQNNQLEFKPKEVVEQHDSPEAYDESMSCVVIPEEIVGQSEEDNTVIQDDKTLALLGTPPECPKESGFSEQWKQQLKELTTTELLERYDGEDWRQEYKYFCYMELLTRKDLETVLKTDES